MDSITISLITIGCIFGGALFGLWLQKRLPVHHLSKESQDVMKLGFGIIGTLTALVLGLLISSAKTSYDAMNTGIVQASSKLILLDRVLAQYGPETQPVRADLKRAVGALLEKVWGRPERGVSRLKTLEEASAMELIQAKLRRMTPQTEPQHELFNQAQQLAAEIAQARWLFFEEAQSELPLAFLAVLIFWLTLIFSSFGLFAPRNVTVLVALLLCACSVSAAVFLVLELSRPLEGVLKVPEAPMRKAYEYLGR